MLLANVLHFVDDQTSVLARLAQRVKPGGRVVFIEYDRREASRWVPFPISAEDLPRLAAAAGLSAPKIVGRKASAYSGDLYVAVSSRS
jgi:2-polyprenyl-3-methyl-5-hydroxy-6-metoxy-1,4-benzoquinol methylase